VLSRPAETLIAFSSMRMNVSLRTGLAAILIGCVLGSSAVVACSSPKGVVLGPSDGGTDVHASSDSAHESKDVSAETGEAEGSDGAVAEAGVIAIPAEAPYLTWTYFETPGALCANGSPAAFALNPAKGSTDLLIFMRAGDICYDYENCIANPTASFLDGYGDAGFQMDLHTLLHSGVFDRSDAANPFRDFNFVYFTYCTGDLHSGNAVTTYVADGGGAMGTIHHVGYVNVGAYLERVVPTFHGVTRVVVSGSSAGGFGAAFNYVRVKKAFPSASIFLIDDSGPYMFVPYLSRAMQDVWKANWGFGPNLPAGCAECDPDSPDGGLANLFLFAAKDPSFRGSLISGLYDQTISNSLDDPPGDPELPCVPHDAGCEFPQALAELNQAFAKAPGEMRAFYVASSDHQWTQNARYATTTVSGVTLESFLGAEIDGGGDGWTSVIAP
jgi:hypothetical protein